MKKYLAVLLVAVCLSSGSAWATSITPDVVTNFYLNGSAATVANPYLTHGQYVNYSHNILDNGFSIGDTLNSVSITFYIHDNDRYGDDVGGHWGAYWDYREFAYLLMDGIATTFEINNGSFTQLTVTALIQLQLDGILNVTLTAQRGYDFHNSIGNFTLYSSILNADYTDNTPLHGDDNSPVPEPASIMLLGLGILGLIPTGRKLKK